MSDVKLSEAEVLACVLDVRRLVRNEMFSDQQVEEQVERAGCLGVSRAPNSAYLKKCIAALDIVLAERRERKNNVVEDRGAMQPRVG